MSRPLYILVSNRSLSTSHIGSWTTRITQLNKNNGLFDFILSPSTKNEKYIYCKKRKFLTWRKELRKFNLKYWVAKDYIRAIHKISRKSSSITVVVMDDTHLLEAVILVKARFKCTVKVIFSFHGFKLSLKEDILNDIDKILFLSQLGLNSSKDNYAGFPDAEVVGNGVDSNIFFPLELSDFYEVRRVSGYSADDEILIWVANDRPKKGIHLFHDIINELLVKFPNLKIIIVGSDIIYKHRNVDNVGRISNEVVANYLKISNYYMFTTFYDEGFGLSMIEALKCGNIVISSDKGAIPEVLHELDFTYLIEDLNDINSWVDAFELARKDTNFGTIRPDRTKTDPIWNYENWEAKFTRAIQE